MADVVAQRDEVCAGFEDVRKEREALSGLRVEQLKQLWDLDNRGRADYANSQTLGDGKLDAFGLGKVDVVKECLVADGA